MSLHRINATLAFVLIFPNAFHATASSELKNEHILVLVRTKNSKEVVWDT